MAHDASSRSIDEREDADETANSATHETESATRDFPVTRRSMMQAAVASGAAVTFGAGSAGGDAVQGEQLLIEPGPTVSLETVAEGLTAPIDFQVANEEADRRFIADQAGQIYVHGPDGLQEEPFLDITDRMVQLGTDNGEGFDERGLLGVAFHPEFGENGRFFVRYSGERGTVTPANWDHTFVVSEFQATDDLSSCDPDSERRLLEIPEPQFNHDAGPLLFGPDGYLYITVGDGGGANDVGPGHVGDWYDENEGGNGQNVTDTLLGGILRIDVDTEADGKPYGIPADNPFAEPAEEEEAEDDGEAEEEDGNGENGGNGDGNGGDGAGEDGGGANGDGGDGAGENGAGDPKEVPNIPGIAEYYAWGMRNPWGMSFTDGGELLAADVGQNLIEEINHVRRGGNYGWNVKEGTHCFSTESPGEFLDDCPDRRPGTDGGSGEALVDPVTEYPHSYGDQSIGLAVVAGAVYTRDDIPDLQDAYVFGDWSAAFDEARGKLFVAYPPEGWPEETEPERSLADQTDQDSPTFDESLWEGLWGIDEITVEADGDLVREGGQLNRYVLAFGTDAEGSLYVLTSQSSSPFGDTGEVHRFVPAGGTSEDGGNG